MPPVTLFVGPGKITRPSPSPGIQPFWITAACRGMAITVVVGTRCPKAYSWMQAALNILSATGHIGEPVRLLRLHGISVNAPAKAAGKVTTNRRSADNLTGDEELHRMREMFARSPSFSALLQGPEHRFVLTNPAYQQLIGHRNVIGLPVREAVPEIEGQGFLELLDKVFATGEPFVGKDVKILLQRTPGGIEVTRYLDFVYQPIKD